MSAPGSGHAGLRWHIWLVPAALTAATVGLLCWGAWVYGYNPSWLSGNYSWWRPAMMTNQGWTLVTTVALLLATLGLYWWPRRRDQVPIGLITVVVLALVAAALGTAAYVPCRGNMSTMGVTFWIFQLFVGQPPNVYQSVGLPGANCSGSPPIGLQLGQITGLGATGIGAIAAVSMLWRKQLDRLQSRFSYDVTIVTGLTALAIPLLRRLTENARRPRNVIVIEPDDRNPLLEEVKLAGARIVIGQPDSPVILRPIISAIRGCALSHLYALSDKVADNEAVIAQAARILGRYKADQNRQPHLVALIDDPRHADQWRGEHSGNWDVWFEDAISSAECTARSLVTQVLRGQPRHLLVCGDGPLTVPVLVELARRAWEQAELVKATSAGLDVALDLALPDALSPVPVERVTLLDRRSRDIKREYRMSAPDAVLDSIPNIDAQQVPWRDDLMRRLDAMDPARVHETAVIIAESPPGSGVHEAGRVARLHRKVPVFVLAAPGHESGGAAIFNLLHPFEPGLLVNGEVPEDTWMRVARQWHECYRLSHPLPPGDPKAAARVPWRELDPFLQQDNILQLRSILTEVAKRGRQWKPVHLVPGGSVIELGESDLTEITKAEHTRWVKRRLTAGQAGGNVVPWAALSPEMRSEVTGYLRSQLGQLEGVGFVPVIPVGGPATAARFERVGLVRASRLTEPLAWTSHTDDEMRGNAGDWRVIDDGGNVRTIGDAEFRSSHELVGEDRWRRVGTYLAWQVSEVVAIRTREGGATARPGDWVVEAPSGERWPVEDEQFRWAYQPSLLDVPAQRSRQTAPGATSTAPTTAT